jgi:hypothetical protein
VVAVVIIDIVGCHCRGRGGRVGSRGGRRCSLGGVVVGGDDGSRTRSRTCTKQTVFVYC